MKIKANTVKEYIDLVPEEKRKPFIKLSKTIIDNLPEGFQEQMSSGMIGYVVPHFIFPDGYHVNPELPLPFINIAAQKNFIALYHKGIYSDEKIYKWFINEYPKHSKQKLGMGKSCIRFKKVDQIPFDLIAELVKKIKVHDNIKNYKKKLKRK